MQGTLFALTDEEVGLLLAMLSERGVQVDDLGLADGSVGPLTRVTFHPSYSYEDFVEGFRPVPSGADQLALRLTDGVFKRVCTEAAAHPDRPYLVLIDEVNRGNLARIFGELITLLEKDKRGLPVVLPQSHQVFTVPENVYLLGTMNTADRSIRLLDAAIRRRFAFEELMPQPVLLRGQLVDDLDLEVFLDELNSRIAQNVGREKQIGHSFLLGKGVGEPAEFERRFTQEILPLLQEYAYEDFDTLAKLVGVEIVDAERKTFRYDLLDDPERLVAALAREFPAQG
jgi:5-methylcytosine-specific restriction protein B